MKILIVILTLASFLQTTILPLNLVLIILICRAYLKISQTNLYLTLIFGLLISHLALQPWGINSLFYLVLVQITQILSKTRLAGNPFLIIPLNITALSVYYLISQIGAQAIFNPVLLVVESALSLPTLYLLKIWEERFIVKGDIKLRW